MKVEKIKTPGRRSKRYFSNVMEDMLERLTMKKDKNNRNKRGK